MLCFVTRLPQRWAVISKTQMKNAKKAFNREQMKCDAKDKKEVCVCLLLFASHPPLLEQHELLCILGSLAITNEQRSQLVTIVF